LEYPIVEQKRGRELFYRFSDDFTFDFPKIEIEELATPFETPLSIDIVRLLKEHERLSIAEIETLTKANRNTLKVRLRELVRDDFIEQNGQARATVYRLKVG